MQKSRFSPLGLSLLLGLVPTLLWGSQALPDVTPSALPVPGPWHIAQHYTNLIEIFGRQIALPQGDWILAGIGVDPTPGQARRAYGVIGTLVLFRLDTTTANTQSVTAFTLIHANAIAIDGGWGISKDCERTDLPFAKIYENGEQHAMCAFVRPLTTATDPSATDLTAWQDAVKLAQQYGWNIPTQWHEAGFRICDWHDFLDIRYAFATAPLEQILEQTNELSATNTTLEVTLTNWIDTMLPRVYLGFRRSLADQPAANMPGRPDTSVQAAVQSKLASLTPEQKLSNSTFSLLKVAVNRVINMTSSIGIDYLFVGNLYVAASLQVVSSTFHGGVDYVEELLWNTYGPQRLRRAGTYDFTYIGQ